MADFSTPDNFPPIIVQAIKRGDMRGLGVAVGLLTQPAWAEYEKVTWQAWAEYDKVTWQAQAEYNKVRQPVWVKYLKITQQAFWDLFAIPLNRNLLWR